MSKAILLRDWEVRAILDERLSMLWRAAPTDPLDDFERLAPFPLLLGCPYASSGAALIGKETWAPADEMTNDYELAEPVCVAYRADRSAIHHYALGKTKTDTRNWNWERIKWRPSSQMPAWASRISLRVESVAVRRLHTIAEDEARSTGVYEVFASLTGQQTDNLHEQWCRWTRRIDQASRVGTQRGLFAAVWDRCGGDFASNPWSYGLTVRRT